MLHLAVQLDSLALEFAVQMCSLGSLMLLLTAPTCSQLWGWSAGPRRMQQAPKGPFCTTLTVPVLSGLEEAVVGTRGLTRGTGSCMT